MLILTNYSIGSHLHEGVVNILASNRAGAWRKFRCQRFGALKPRRQDYTIAKVGTLEVSAIDHRR